MFELEKDFNENGIALKAGKYSKEDIIKLYGGEDKFNYCFTCTSLKDVLKESKAEIIEEVQEKLNETNVVEEVQEKLNETNVVEEVQEKLNETNVVEEVQEKLNETNVVEEVQEEFPPIEITYIAKEDIKKGKKVVFKKDDKITLEELESHFTLEEVADKLIETKGV